VMMLDIDFAELRAGFIRNFPLGFALALVLLMELILGAGAYRAGAVQLGKPDGHAAVTAGQSNIEAIGALLYTRYLFLFEAAGLVLLVAMIGAIVLTHRQRSDVRGQNISRQNARRPQDATRNVAPEVGKGVTL
jgi:NADH-quinone oxidoreductase subunit J